MRTEARRKYRCGFVLTEQELRRIHDVADQQMKRALIDAPYVTRYELKFRNGAISEPLTLDEIFDGENWGSTAIRRVSMSFQGVDATPKTRISIAFAYIEEGDSSISYAIDGDDRDWVFVASSQLSERITRVERRNIQQMFSSKLLTPVILLVFLVSMMGWMMTTGNRDFRTRADTVQQLRHEWKSGTLHDPVDVVLRMEEANEAGFTNSGFFGHFEWLFGLAGATLVLLFASQPALNYIYPPYNFVWGESQREYEKRRGIGRFVLVGVILTILLGVLANFLSKKLGW